MTDDSTISGLASRLETGLCYDGVTKSYQGRGREPPFIVFKDVSFEVARSEFLAVIGPSGCGKSTLLRIAAGLIPPSAGRVYLDGVAVTSPPRGVVYLFQQYSKSLFPWRTVLDNVLFPLEMDRSTTRAQKKERGAEYLRQVGLSGFEGRYTWQLSGGMQQRVAIARALVAKPSVLLLDEPFSAVDALTRLELQALLLRLWGLEKFTALLVTHDVEEAIFLADRIAVLSARPTRLAGLVDVPLPRPREPIATREDPRFLDLRHRLTAQLLESNNLVDSRG